ncbi:MAG TPA: carboxymuconolactone decarboxylase family protein [Pseudorhodoplanes sp.]|nr:carboxymuconolactone decarboxylase family protein [Pseudorhodoplanes sp.]
MPARMKNPVLVLPDAVQPLQMLHAVVHGAGVPVKTLNLVHLRTSQINGCSFCVDGGVKHSKKAGETDERLHAVAAWRESPHFDQAEVAALALAEAMTRLADSSDAVPDAVWNEAAAHYDERGLATLVLWIAVTNLYNRINVATRQPAGKGW